MRRFMVLMAVVVALGVAFAAPVSAAPTRNPSVLTYMVTCPDASFEGPVIAKGVPGWPDGDPGTTPLLLLGGTFTLYEDGEFVFSAEDPIPAGLESQLETCTVGGPLETDAFQWVIDPAYVLVTPHA
jgi:hypothetical protein